MRRGLVLLLAVPLLIGTACGTDEGEPDSVGAQGTPPPGAREYFDSLDQMHEDVNQRFANLIARQAPESEVMALLDEMTAGLEAAEPPEALRELHEEWVEASRAQASSSTPAEQNVSGERMLDACYAIQYAAKDMGIEDDMDCGRFLGFGEDGNPLPPSQ